MTLTFSDMLTLLGLVFALVLGILGFFWYLVTDESKKQATKIDERLSDLDSKLAACGVTGEKFDYVINLTVELSDYIHALLSLQSTVGVRLIEISESKLHYPRLRDIQNDYLENMSRCISELSLIHSEALIVTAALQRLESGLAGDRTQERIQWVSQFNNLPYLKDSLEILRELRSRNRV